MACKTCECEEGLKRKKKHEKHIHRLPFLKNCDAYTTLLSLLKQDPK